MSIHGNSAGYGVVGPDEATVVARGARMKKGFATPRFAVQLEELVWQTTTVFVHAGSLAEAMMIANSPIVTRNARWLPVECAASRVVGVHGEEGELYAAELAETDPRFKSSVLLDTCSLDYDLEAAQVAWDAQKRRRLPSRRKKIPPLI